MKQAGRELCVTPGAVSQQVANLESILGIGLFERRGGRLILTPAGRRYLPPLTRALDELEAATVDLVTHGGDARRLVIGSLHTFSINWLIPRLSGFGAAHPDIRPVVETLELNFATPSRAPDVSARCIDVGFYYGDGEWPGMISHELFAESQVVVARKGFVPPGLAGDLERLVSSYPRLVHTTRPRAWDEWSASTGITLAGPPGPGFEHLFMVMEAARNDMGLALLPLQLLGRALVMGELEVLSPEASPSRGSYYLFYSALRAAEPSICAFRDWVLGLCP
ncbi:Transcriptional regulator [Plesiocystis pacifica SIR-1]|uniref:Transcriptional regulator n=2 Tax=Plesiocystis pacifica TaxID=191768 RepID=A6G9W5_9BACT|nr:Transcriptional regulator [Plesiocystis pacifica SIR-1]